MGNIPGSGRVITSSLMSSGKKLAEKLSVNRCACCPSPLPLAGSGVRLCQTCEGSLAGEAVRALLSSDEWQVCADADSYYDSYTMVNGRRWYVVL